MSTVGRDSPSWETVKELDKQYMRAQLARTLTPGPKVIGIDEISIRKGHDYRIVVSDLLSEAVRSGLASGPQAGEHEAVLRLALRVAREAHPLGRDGHVENNATQQAAPNAAILYDKFHVMRHLGEALAEVRKAEYGRLKGQDRKCPRYLLPPRGLLTVPLGLTVSPARASEICRQ